MAEQQPRARRLAPIAALALAGVAAVAFAAGMTTHGGVFAADPSATPTQGQHVNGGGFGPGGGWMHMGGRMGMRGGPGQGVSITITAIDGTKLTLKTTDGWTRTIDATGATVTKGSQSAALGDLKVGDTINFRETRQTDGTYKIDAIEIVLPKVAGTVSSVNGNSVTIKLADGSSKTITVTSSTTYTDGPKPGNTSGNTVTKADLVAGVEIAAEGTVDSSGNFTATTVRIAPARVAGTVASKTTDSIVVTTADGKSVTVKVSSSTTYMVPGQANATLANVATGNRIVAQGRLNSDGSLTASAVMAGPAGQPGFSGGGMGRGHMGGGGPGFQFGSGPMMPGTGAPDGNF